MGSYPRSRIMRVKNLLLTGRPGCGKTTALRRLLERLHKLRVRGFYTQEIRRGKQRLGFVAIGLDGGREVLAHVETRSVPRVGRYGVRVPEFETLLGTELDRPADEVDLFIIDEIGKMECYSDRFIALSQRALDSAVPVIATVALRGTGFIEAVKKRADTRLIQVTAENRDQLPEQLHAEVKALLRHAAE
jgi:nucleoside-triphosphatase